MIILKGKFLASIQKVNPTDKSVYRIFDILETNKLEGWVVKKVKVLDNLVEFKLNTDVEFEILPIVYKTDHGDARISFRMA